MKRNILNFGKMVAMGLTIAVSTISCNRDGNASGEGIDPTPSATPTLNIIHRVAGTSALSDWSFQPLKEAQMKTGEITFQSKGFNLPQDRTHQMYSSNNGNTVYVYSSMSKLLTKYEVSGDNNLYKKVGEIDFTAILGNSIGNFKVLDDKNAVVYLVTRENQQQNGTYIKTVSTLKIGKINLENFTADLSGVKLITLPEVESSPELPNAHISGIEHPVLVNGKLYFGMRKLGYDPTKTGNVANENGYFTGTLTIDFPSLTNVATIHSTTGKGMSTYPHVFYAPSYVKTETNAIYHSTPLKGFIYKINSGLYDNSYQFDVKTALGENTDIVISGIHYASNGIAYITYAPLTAMNGGIRYTDGKAVWSIARVDLNAKTAIKMNVTNNLWLTFHQSSRFVNGKLYMALCPMTGDGNVYIFDPTKADANGFEKGATLKSAGGAVYLGVF